MSAKKSRTPMDITLDTINNVNELIGESTDSRGAMILLGGNDVQPVAQLKGNSVLIATQMANLMMQDSGFKDFMLSMAGAYLINNPTDRLLFINSLIQLSNAKTANIKAGKTPESDS